MAEAAKLSAAYFNPSHPGSFGGPGRLAESLDIKYSSVKRFLEQIETYNKNKGVRHKFVRRKISSPTIDYVWQADLIDVSKYSRINKGIHFLLTVIDVLSRYAFVYPLRRKTAKEVTEGFLYIINTNQRKPKFLQCDEGNEFFNRTLAILLKAEKIILYHNHSPLKAAMVERFNRSLMTRLQKQFTYRKQNVYHDVLQNVVDSYNSTVHRSIACAPKDVDKYNQMDAWFKSNKDLIKRNVTKSKYKVGNFVRMKVLKSVFSKGYASSFSDDTYKISEVIQSKPVTYKISDNEGNNVLGIFYAQELSLVRI